MDSSTPSLFIGFDITRTHALLRVSAECREDLSVLLARFPEGRLTELLTAVVPLEAFLNGLDALATWRNPEDVRWEPAFQAVVEEMLDDADRVENFLAGGADEFHIKSEGVAALLGDNWNGGLTSFQERDIAHLLNLGHSANFSVPGAGKTRVAYAVFTALRNSGKIRRLLVVSPKSAYEAWKYEGEVCFCDDLNIEVLNKQISPASDVLLVNYERLQRSLPSLASWIQGAPTMVVLDEAHRMKLGASGVYGAACMTLGALSPVRMILSGTPAPNGAKDLENLFSFVWPGRGRRVVSQAVDGGNLARASSVLKPMYTRTTKQELGLPPVQTRVRFVDMPPLHREIYDAMVGSFSVRAYRSRSDFENLGKAALRMLMAATSPALLVKGSTRYEPLEFRVPPLSVPASDQLYDLLRDLPDYEVPPKYQETVAIVAANAAVGRKTLIWASFVRSIMSLEGLLAQFNPAVVHGGSGDREGQIQKFREDQDCYVLISNPATLGEGISLHQTCHDAIYVDRDFQAGRFLQSLDRIHRLGLAPETDTRVTVLTARSTIDEVVADRLKEKLDFMGRILDDPSVQALGDPEDEVPVAGGLDAADLAALLKHANAA